VAEAIHQALEMSRAERRARMQRMRRYLMEHNVYHWAANILGDLRELRIETPEYGERSPARAEAIGAGDAANRKLA
jgi:trehalose 6-phosphate synthase